MVRMSIEIMKDNGFKQAKKRSRRYPTQTIVDTDFADDKFLLANTPAEGETQLHNLERTAAGVGLHVDAYKTEHMCFNQRGDITTLNGSSLKQEDKLTYRGNSVSSTETNINTRLEKAWTAIDRLSVIWKSNLNDKMKCSFLPSSGRIDTAIWMHYRDANETYGEKAWRHYRRIS